MILDREFDFDRYDIPILIVAKSGLKYQWVADGIQKFTDERCVVIDGDTKERMALYDDLKLEYYKYVITSYELIMNDITTLSKLKIGLIIWDEAHKIRNHRAEKNKASKKLNTKFNIFMTGSPLGNKVEELFGLVSVADPDYFGSYKDFCARHLLVRRGKYGPEVYGYKNLNEITGKIEKIAIRRTDKEVEMQMPKIMESNIEIEMSDTQKVLDDALLAEMDRLSQKAEEIAIYAQNDPAKYMPQLEALKGAIQGCIALRMGAADSPELFLMSKSKGVVNKYSQFVKNNKSGKMDQLIDQILEIQSVGYKVVIFSLFETMVQIIMRELAKHKIGAVCFTGQMDAKQKEASRIAFKTQSYITCFVGTNSAAEGWTKSLALISRTAGTEISYCF